MWSKLRSPMVGILERTVRTPVGTHTEWFLCFTFDTFGAPEGGHVCGRLFIYFDFTQYFTAVSLLCIPLSDPFDDEPVLPCRVMCLRKRIIFFVLLDSYLPPGKPMRHFLVYPWRQLVPAHHEAASMWNLKSQILFSAYSSGFQKWIIPDNLKRR